MEPLLRVVKPCQHSLDAEIVSQHLSDRTSQELHVCPTEYIWYACNKTCCSILDSLKPHKAVTTCYTKLLRYG